MFILSQIDHIPTGRRGRDTSLTSAATSRSESIKITTTGQATVTTKVRATNRIGRAKAAIAPTRVVTDKTRAAIDKTKVKVRARITAMVKIGIYPINRVKVGRDTEMRATIAAREIDTTIDLAVVGVERMLPPYLKKYKKRDFFITILTIVIL